MTIFLRTFLFKQTIYMKKIGIALLASIIVVSCEKEKIEVGQYYQGGIVVYKTNDGHGLIISIDDFPPSTWDSANIKCNNLVIENNGDWRLPIGYELDSAYSSLYLKGLGGFNSISQNTDYWTSSPCGTEKYIEFKFGENGRQDCEDASNNQGTFRAVRNF